jgi:hypothetical protein
LGIPFIIIASNCYEKLEYNGVLGGIVYRVSFNQFSFEAVHILFGIYKFFYEDSFEILEVDHFV